MEFCWYQTFLRYKYSFKMWLSFGSYRVIYSGPSGASSAGRQAAGSWVRFVATSVN